MVMIKEWMGLPVPVGVVWRVESVFLPGREPPNVSIHLRREFLVTYSREATTQPKHFGLLDCS
uniref:Uncharacterized protein n=1 Tax=Leersia perrieri TaxID=77586 RepID=A0A0D9XR47_9ORYZ